MQNLLNAYPTVPIPGLSATAIRYLDNQRVKKEKTGCARYGQEAYYADHGHTNMPADFVMEGVWLRRWLSEPKARLNGVPGGHSKSHCLLQQVSHPTLLTQV